MQTERRPLRSFYLVGLTLALLLICLSCALATEGAAQGKSLEADREDMHVHDQTGAAKAPHKETVPLEEPAGKVPQRKAFELLDKTVRPGTFTQLNWPVELSSLKFDLPVIVVHGAYQGPVIGVIAALHGDELNGIEIARQVMHDLDPKELAGTLIAVPIVNIEGFVQKSRYMADRRDLNRYFPGDPKGITPARYAHDLFQQIILKCEALIDIHTGSYFRTNLPQLRADMSNDAVADMVAQFGALTVVHSVGAHGTLRGAATEAGIPAVTMEVGGPLALVPRDVSFGVQAVRTFLGEVGMIPRAWVGTQPLPFYCESFFLIAEQSGILLADVELGDEIKKDQQIAMIVNPVTNLEYTVKAPYDAIILGKAENQFVSAGYVIFRFGIETSVEEIVAKAKKGQDLGTFP